MTAIPLRVRVDFAGETYGQTLMIEEGMPIERISDYIGRSITEAIRARTDQGLRTIDPRDYRDLLNMPAEQLRAIREGIQPYQRDILARWADPPFTRPLPRTTETDW